MVEETSRERGLFGSLKQLAASVAGTARTRLELLAIELAEEKLRLTRLLVWALVAVMAAALGSLVLLAFLVTLFWEQRLFILGGGLFFFLGLAFWGGMQASVLIRRQSGVFRSSLAELSRDKEALLDEAEGAASPFGQSHSRVSEP